MNNQAKTGSSARVHGKSCPNPACSMHQGLVLYGIRCTLCGHPMRKASASVAVFKWEEEPVGCGKCANYIPEDEEIGKCIDQPPVNGSYPVKMHNDRCPEFLR